MQSIYRQTLLVIALGSLTAAVQAVEPLNDSDLGEHYMQLQDNKKLPMDVINQKTSAKVEQKDDSTELHLEIAKAAEPLSTPALDQVNLSAPNIRMDADALSKYVGEYASYNLGSERYSYFWHGNYDKIYDASDYQRYLFDSSTKTFTVDGNIHGTVFMTGSRISDEDAAHFFRSNWVF